MQIYISSLAYLDSTVEAMISSAKQEKLNLEFSSGLPYRPDMIDIFLTSDLPKMAHNYFPAPEIPFVLNLASSDENVRQKSIDHCCKLLAISKQVGAPFFAAHAGFCIDPNPNELGKKIHFEGHFDRQANKELFISSLNTLLQKADVLDIDLLIENNVIASFNLLDDQINPFLCCTSEEMDWMIKTIDHKRLGILLDTGHLKVSCKTLGIDLNQEMQKISPLIRAIHHNDNNSFSDTNDKLDENYWFLPYIQKFKELVHVIEVKKIDSATISEQINILQKYGR